MPRASSSLSNTTIMIMMTGMMMGAEISLSGVSSTVS